MQLLVGPLERGNRLELEEGEWVSDRTQASTRCTLEAMRLSLPSHLREIHPDNDSSAIQGLLPDHRSNRIPL